MDDVRSIALADIAPRHSPPADSAHRITRSPAKFMRRNGQRLLWVDDSHTLLSLYKSVFESLGFAVWITTSPAEALSHASLTSADVAILDYEMPGMDGEMLACRIKDRDPSLPVILHSGSTCIPRSASDCVDAICLKGAPREELVATIQRLSMSGARAFWHEHKSPPPPCWPDY